MLGWILLSIYVAGLAFTFVVLLRATRQSYEPLFSKNNVIAVLKLWVVWVAWMAWIDMMIKVFLDQLKAEKRDAR